MTTIPPSSVPPPSGAATPGAPTAPVGPSGALLTQVPAAVRTAVPGTVITGTVVGRDNHGQTLLQTDAGVIAFKTAAALTVGSQISLQIQTVGSQFQAVILSALPATKQGSAAAPGATPAAAGGSASAPATTIAPSVSTGSVITATVIGPSGGPAPPPTAQGTPSAPPSSAGAAPAALPAAPGSAGAAPAAPAAQGVPAAAPGTAAQAGAPSPPPAAAPAAGTPAPATAPPAAATPSALLAQQSSASPTGLVSAAVARYAATPGAAPAAPAGASATPAPATASPAPPASATLPGAAPAPLQQAPAGTAVQLRFIPTTPGAPPPPAAPGAAPATAIIVAHAANGQTLIDTPVGRLTVTLPSNVSHQPIGSSIALEIVSVAKGTPAAALLALAPNPAKTLPTLGQEWPTLKTAIAALTAADPAFARQLIENAIPRLGTPRFLNQLLGQLATGGGPADARALLGETVHAILERAGRGDILARLDTELREMNRLNSGPSDWRLIFLPIADMSELRQLRVFTRKKKGSAGKEREHSGRFIVEADFDAYGPLQLDGLVQKPRIDLIVRSHVEFTPSMQAGIAEVFGRTCEVSGLIGKIFFNASPTFPVSPLDEIAQAGPGLSV